MDPKFLFDKNLDYRYPDQAELPVVISMVGGYVHLVLNWK